MKYLGLIALYSSLLHAQLHEAAQDNLSFDQAQRYCRDYQGGGWRTLQIKELFELKGEEGFTSERSFWSANSVVTGPSKSTTGSEGDALIEGSTHGYSFYLQEGDVTISPAEKQLGVICSNAPLQLVKHRFEKTADGVADRRAGIVWQPLEATDKKAKYDYASAKRHCASLELSEREWRLPTLDELYGIVSYERTAPTLDTGLFGVMMSRYYWSEDELNGSDAYVVGFKLGSVATSSKKNSSYVRCVSDIEE